MNDKLPPHAHGAEQALLGCQIADQNSIMAVSERLGSDAAFHYDHRHQEIQRSIFGLFGDGKPVEIITIQQALKERGMLENIGGIAYLSELLDSFTTVHNLPYYIEQIEEKASLRRLVQLCESFSAKAMSGTASADLIERFESAAMSLRKVQTSDSKPVKQLVHEALNDIERAFLQQGAISGLSTGLADLDAASDGLHGGEFVIIAALPSVGKTSLAMNIVESIVLNSGVPVGVFSAEMSGRSLMRRMICSTARVSFKNIRQGFMAESDFPKIKTAAAQLSTSPLHIDDSSDLTIAQVRARGRRMVQQFGVKLIVADYAQLFSSPGAENRTNELDQISKGFKAMAKELDVPVILLSQLNDDGKLKGARAFGEDADGIWKLSRNAEQSGGDGEQVTLLLDKQRNEERGIIIPLVFLKPYTRFELAAKVSEADAPC